MHSHPDVAMPHSKRLNDYTRTELETALASYLAEKVTENAECRWCGETFRKNRRWQEFCTKAHQIAWNANAKDREIIALQGMVAQLRRELEEVRTELSRVRPVSP